MIGVRVPGKLFVAGEYAVLEPGGRAIVVAVNRFLTVRLAPRADDRITVTSALTDFMPIELALGEPDPRVPLVAATIGTCQRLALETGRYTTGFDMLIDSELDDMVSGAKFGLGSSGAVTVAVTRVLARHYNLPLDTLRMLKTALLASISVDPSGSGGDVAASLLGGWICYTAPDRADYAERLQARTPIITLINQPWLRLSAFRVPAPRDLLLLAGWTGTPISTRNLVANFHTRADLTSETHRSFVADSNACVQAFVAALNSGNDKEVSRQLNHAGTILHDYTSTLDLPLQTPSLRMLSRLAHALGVAAKSSGAGGGDCGIALVPQTQIRTLTAAWRAARIHPLDLSAATAESPFGGEAVSQERSERTG